MAYLIVLALMLCVIVAYYSAKDGKQIDVARAVTVFLCLMVAMGWGLYWHEIYTADQRFEDLFVITHSVATVAENCRVGVDSTLQTLKAFEKLWPTLDTIR